MESDRSEAVTKDDQFFMASPKCRGSPWMSLWSWGPFSHGLKHDPFLSPHCFWQSRGNSGLLYICFFCQSWWTSFSLTGQRLRALWALQASTAKEQAAWQGAVGGFESPTGTVTSMILGYIGCPSQVKKQRNLRRKKHKEETRVTQR